MKEILTEFDVLQEAMKRIDMDEVAMPIHNGRVITENRESYCKMQQILNAPEMIKSHAYILNLNPEQLEEDEIERVDKLWKLGVDRGFITTDDNPTSTQSGLLSQKTDAAELPVKRSPETSAFAYAAQKVDIPCWTVLYSATDKNGDIKTGECYSNSINTRSAKADCYAKLERCGYSNISILAIEAGDPDNCDCYGDDGSSKQLLAEMPPKDCKETPNGKMIPDDEFMNAANESEDVEEADTSFDEPKSAHASGTVGNQVRTGDFDKNIIAGKTDDENTAEGADYKTLNREFLTAADDYQQIADLQGENSTAAKNAFKKVQATYEDCYAAVPSPDDERELLSDVNSYGFKLAADNCTILEAEEELVDESGNPYLAGMKTTDLNGPMKVSSGKKAASAKKLDEEDEEDEEDDDSSDDADDSGDTADDSDDSGDTADDSDDSDDTDDDSNDSEEESTDDDSDTSGDETTDDSGDSSEDDDSDSDDDTGTDEDSGDSDDSEETNDEEDNDSDDSEDSDEETDDEDEDEDEESDDDEVEDDDSETESKDLSDEEKAQYKSDYKKTFKDIMLKCDFEDKCFDDLSIAEKVEFFTKLQKAWKKNEPKDFMSDKEIEQLNKVVVKK